MNNSYFIKNFGKITVLPIYLLVVASNAFVINISYNQYLIDFLNVLNFPGHTRMIVLLVNVLSFFILTIAFLRCTSLFYSKQPRLFLGLFVPFVVLFQFLLVSALWDFIENKSIRSSK